MKTMTGFSRQVLLVHFLLISIFSVGQVTQEWVARFAASTNSFSEGATDLAIDQQGNVYVTGATIRTGSFIDYTTIKYNSAGVVQWVNRYSGPGSDADEPTAIAVDDKGNVYVTGSSGGVSSGSDYATIKINSTGGLLWATRYNGPGNSFDIPSALALDKEGNVFVTGQSAGDGTLADYATIKYNNATGAIQWVSRYNGPGDSTDRATSLAIDNDGNVYVIGASAGNGTKMDYATIRYNNATGAVIWVSRFNGAGNDYDGAESIAADNAGNVYVTGVSVSGIVPDPPFPSLRLFDIATIKYNAVGAQQWVDVYDEGGDDDVASVKVDNQGNVYVAGSISGSPPQLEDPDLAFGVIKYSSAGVRLWVAKYSAPAQFGSENSARDQALDSDGNVYVTGQALGGEYLTVKFSKNGQLQWAERYKVGLNQNARAVAVDASGNVYVTGYSSRVDCLGCYDFATIKYVQGQTACGKKGDKVLVCHKGKETLCIDKDAVYAHLCHGDQLGACPLVTSCPDPDNEHVGKTPGSFRVFVAPNPAAVTTKIFYELPVDGRVFITIYDMHGRKIKTLVEATRQTGFYSVDFNVANLQTGVYTYQIMVKTAKKCWSKTGKISVMK